MRALTATTRALVLLPFLATSALAAAPAGAPTSNTAAAAPAETSLKAKATAFREQFHSTRNSLLAGNGASSTRGGEIGVGAGFGVVAGIRTGIVKVASEGKNQLRVNISPYWWGSRAHGPQGLGFGAFATVGAVSSGGKLPVTATQTGSGFAMGVGGSSTAEGKNIEVMAGPFIGGFDAQSRANLSIPLTPKWASKPLRQSNKGIRLADQAIQAIDSNQTAKAASLIDKMEILSISLNKSIAK